MRSNIPLYIFVLALWLIPTGIAYTKDDTRQLVKMPLKMQQHMLANMRDHLAALMEIQQALAQGTFEQAADIAEQRIGWSSLKAHGAKHMAKHMPVAMRQMGTALHQAASRFALVVEEVAITDDFKPVFEAMAQITQQCVTCHSTFRLR